MVPKLFGFRRFKKVISLGLLFCLSGLIALGITQLRNQSSTFVSEQSAAAVTIATEPIQPIPLEVELDNRKVDLGSKLFQDPQLSSDGTISCATCHILNSGGTDGLPTSEGMLGSDTGINSPTVFNAAFHYRLNWDGSAATLEEQADGPVSKAQEMGGMSWQEVSDRLRKSPEYVEGFNQIYSNGINGDNIKNAIAVFQQSLYTPNAPFDQYLRGDENAISDKTKRGYGLFKSYGCVTCHQGMLVGGNMFQSLGIFGDYFADRGNIVKADLGRYNVTGEERDRHVFKVPSLRNIALTAPYLHDGSVENLDEAIKLMGEYQLGVDIPQDDVDAIMLFLRSLTGEYQGVPL